MRWKFNTLLGRLKDKDAKAAQYREIGAKTGVAISTLSQISKGTKRVDLDVAERILFFFEEALEEELTTQDLIEYKSSRKKP